MSVRLFAGYFLALAACATIAFSTPDAESSPPPANAAAIMSAFYNSHLGAYSGRHHPILKRSQMAQAN